MLQVSNKRKANDHHLELVNHHQRQLECLTRLLDSQNQLSPPQPSSDWRTSAPAVPVDYANASAPLIFPGSQPSSLTHLQPCPVEGSTCPVEGSACPVEGPICPVEGLSCPVEGPSCPVEGPSCPVEGLSCPVEGPSCPVEGLSCPVKGSACPVEGPSCPVEGSLPPVRSSACPVEGPSCPVEGSIPPVRSSACPAESLAGLVDGYPVHGPFQGNTQSASRHAANRKAHPEEGFQLPSWKLPVPHGTATQAASFSCSAANTPIVKGGLVEADTAAVHGLARQMEADAVAAAIGLMALKSAPAECEGITSRQRQNAQLTAATTQRAQPQHQRQRKSNKNSGANSTDSSVMTHHQLKSGEFSAKSCQQHQTDIVAAPLATGKNHHSRQSRLQQTLGALQRPQHHAADHAAPCPLHEQQFVASGSSTRLLPIQCPQTAGKAPFGFTQQQQTAVPATRGCNAELAEAQPASSAELSTTSGFHDDRSQSYLPVNSNQRAQSQLSAISTAGASLTTARTADVGSRAVPDSPEDPQTSMGAGSLRPAHNGPPTFQTMGAAGDALRDVCNGPGTSKGTMGPISGASTATCCGLNPQPQSTSRRKHDGTSAAQPAEQNHDFAMPDAVMTEADEEHVSYNRRGRRICLPARFKAMSCHDSQVKIHAFMCADA